MSRKKFRHIPAKVTTIATKPTIPANPLPKGCFLHSEDEHQFCTLLGEYLRTYQPQHRDEYDLVTEAVYAKWRQQRYWLAESAHLEITIAKSEATLRKERPRADNAAQLANAVAQSEDLMRLYLRYNHQLTRQYLRCLKEVRDLQHERQTPPPDTPPMNLAPASANPPHQFAGQENTSPNEAIEPDSHEPQDPQTVPRP
jgi:hypothetical protein